MRWRSESGHIWPARPGNGRDRPDGPLRPRRIAVGVAVCVAVLVVVAACTAVRVRPSADPSSADPSSGRSGVGAQSPAAPGVSAGWTITVYYTAVEEYHSGKPKRVAGCTTIDCSRGDADLGTYPADFVQAVHDEGTGRTRSGRYLNWSYDTGYWLDTAPRDTAGRALVAFESAAADRDVLPTGSTFSIVDCGREEGGGAIDPKVCDALRAGRWRITDEFTPGLGGKKHVDVYIGTETGPGFTDSPWYTTLSRASLRIA